MRPRRISKRKSPARTRCQVEGERTKREGSGWQQIHSLDLLREVGAGHAGAVGHDRERDEGAEPPERALRRRRGSINLG